ncbi:MAG TPA: hypothetical protein VEW69_11065, partial [Alphaproteobacteria bacterium]|nr:hypothetical protein [Alphaproteobacteria bacterium]
MAVGCILASLPVAFLKYPWLPATIMEYAELRREPAPGATQSYYEGRQHNLERTELALVWYFIGTVALGGLVVVAAGIVPWWVELAIWILTFAAG